MANTYLVQYSVPGKDYSVGFSTREAAEKAVAKLTAHGRAAVIVEPKQTITREENIMENTNTDYTVRKVGDNYGLYFRGQLVESGIFATRKTAVKYKHIAEAERRVR